MAKPLHTSSLPPRSKSLTRPILVGGTLHSGWVVGPLGLAAIIAIVGVIMMFRTNFIVGLVTLAIAAALSVPGLIAVAIQLTRRRWLEVTLDGFVLVRRDGSRLTINDEQIIALSNQTWPNSDGSYMRRVLIEIEKEERTETIECFYHVAANNADPMYALVERNTTALVRRTVEGQDQRARLIGVGWHYDRDGLHVHHGPRRGVYPLEELTYLAYFDSQVKIYRNAEVNPFFCMPDTSRNAQVLGRLLWEIMSQRPTVNDPLPSEPLGRRMRTIYGRDYLVGSFILIPFGILMAFFLIGGVLGSPFFLIPAAGFGILFFLGVWLVWRTSYMRIDYHQFGVRQPGRGRSLLFENLGSMRWTNTNIRLDPMPGVVGPCIVFQTISLYFTHDHAVIRDYIASKIAERWLKELGNGPVRWTPNLRFLPQALEYQTSGVFGRGAPVSVPYSATSYYLIQNKMDLFVQGASYAVLKQSIEVTNFHPGLILLNWIYQSINAQGKPEEKVRFSLPTRKPTTDDRFTRGEQDIKSIE